MPAQTSYIVEETPSSGTCSNMTYPPALQISLDPHLRVPSQSGSRKLGRPLLLDLRANSRRL